MPGSLQNKVAIVTGSSSGIGRAISLAYAREGARVICADLQPLSRFEASGDEDETRGATHDRITEAGGEAIFVKVDVTVAEQVEELVKTAVRTYGRLDIMLNNAGIGVANPQPIWSKPLPEWHTMLATNLSSVFHGLKYASAQMLTQEPLPASSATNNPLSRPTRGNIITSASVLGLTGQSGASDYCAAKGGVVNLTKAAALDCAPHGIQVNAFAPSYAATHLTSNFFEDEETRGALEALHPFGGLGKARDLVGVAVWLAGEGAGWVSGVTIPVDGGFLAGKM